MNKMETDKSGNALKEQQEAKQEEKDKANAVTLPGAEVLDIMQQVSQLATFTDTGDEDAIAAAKEAATDTVRAFKDDQKS
jgi:hypothetical protein